MKKILLIITIITFCSFGCAESEETGNGKEDSLNINTEQDEVYNDPPDPPEFYALSGFSVYNRPFSYQNKVNRSDNKEVNANTLKEFLKTGKPVTVEGDEKVPSKLERGEFYFSSAEDYYKVDLDELQYDEQYQETYCIKKAHIKTDTGIDIYIFSVSVSVMNKSYDIICSVKDEKLISYLQACLYDGPRGAGSADHIPFGNTYIIDKFHDPTVWYIEVSALTSYDKNFKEPKWQDCFEQSRYFEIKPDGAIELTDKFDIAIEEL